MRILLFVSCSLTRPPLNQRSDYFSADAEGYAARWEFPWPRSAMAFISFTNAFFLLDILLNFVTGQ